MNDAANRIIELKKEFMIPCLYHFYQDPPVLRKGEMQYLFDSDGKKYTDFFSGVTVMNCGHCNPDIIGPAMRRIATLQHTTTIYLNEAIVELAEALVDYLDSSLRKVFFVNSGSEANEGAVLLARLWTGKSGLIALDGGLHGRTALTMSLTGIPMWRTLPESQLEKINFAPRPHCSNCSLGKNRDSCDFACVKAVGEILAKNDDIAAMIAEPIQGNGGIILPPEGYFERLKELLESHGVLLILDEVQTGLGRTGARYAFNRTGIEPDILTTAKALGNGFPIAAFCATDEIASIYTKPGASTTGGNPVAAAAALAVLRYHTEHELEKRADSLGIHLKRKLSEIQKSIPHESELRGEGLMIGLRMGAPTSPRPKETDLILESMKNKGFLIGKTGLDRDVLTFLPPLVIEEGDIDEMAAALLSSFQSISKECLS